MVLLSYMLINLVLMHLVELLERSLFIRLLTSFLMMKEAMMVDCL
nr:MAG TPA: hypothetical protein [Crassvirales sp.]